LSSHMLLITVHHSYLSSTTFNSLHRETSAPKELSNSFSSMTTRFNAFLIYHHFSVRPALVFREINSIDPILFDRNKRNYTAKEVKSKVLRTGTNWSAVK
jgi:hypothetical protein